MYGTNLYCPECRAEMIQADCMRSSHNAACDCKDDYVYCVNETCSKRYHNINKYDLGRARNASTQALAAHTDTRNIPAEPDPPERRNTVRRDTNRPRSRSRELRAERDSREYSPTREEP